MEKFVKKFEEFLFIFLFINPLLDLIYGTQLYFLNGGTGMLGTYQLEIYPAVSISLVIRMVLLLFMLVYILLMRDRTAIITGVLMAVCLGVTMVLALRRGNYNPGEDIACMARYAYNLVALITYAHVFESSGKNRDELRKHLGIIIGWTLLVITAGVILPYLAHVGFYTYADKFGLRGSRGMFYSGNDIACVMMTFLPLLLCELFREKRITSRRSVYYIACAALCMNTMLVLGTKTVYLALAATVAALFVYAVIDLVRSKNRLMFLQLIITAALFAIIYLLISLSTGNGVTENMHQMQTMTTENLNTNGAQAAVFSGRTDKLFDTWKAFRAALPLSALFGIGRGSMDYVIEMDVFELLFYFGIVGTVVFTWIYIRNCLCFAIDFFRSFSLCAFCGALSLGLCLGYMFMAGHTLFSVTSGFYFALTILYVRWFTPKEEKTVKIA